MLVEAGLRPFLEVGEVEAIGRRGVRREAAFDNTELNERIDRNLELHFRLSGGREEGGSCRSFIAKQNELRIAVLKLPGGAK